MRNHFSTSTLDTVAAVLLVLTRPDGISDFLIPLLKPFGPSQPLNLKASIPEISAELSKTYPALKRIYSKCIETDAVAPAVGATLEWLKAVGGRNLPTDFEEMELDCEPPYRLKCRGSS